MTTGFRFAPGGRERLLLLDYLFDAAYGAPESVLGNQSNALDEAVYIILSFQTNLERFRATWRSLRAAFPRWDDADRASVNEIADVLRAGGLHRQKAKAIKRLISAISDEFGELSLSALREMDDAAAERVLTRLPGLSWKGARCVLLYSFQRDVLPRGWEHVQDPPPHGRNTGLFSLPSQVSTRRPANRSTSRSQAALPRQSGFARATNVFARNSSLRALLRTTCLPKTRFAAVG